MKKYKNNLVPRLRFPEFKNFPKWEEKTLGYIFDFSIKPESSISFNKQKIITVKLHTAGIVKNERTETLTGRTNYYIRKSGQFIFSKIDFLNGAFGIIPLELNGFVSSTDVPAFSFNKNIIPTYFKYWLSENYKKIKIERTGTSNTLKRISIDKFFDINLHVPTTLQEQQKIADCLSSLDELITAEDEKLTLLKSYKKGLMQKLFPPEGETVPELRFPEFKDTGEWYINPLGIVCDVLQGYGFPEIMQGKQNGKYPFCKVSDISNAVINNGCKLLIATNYIDDVDLIKLNAKLVPKGATVFAKIGEGLRLNRRAIVLNDCLIDNNTVGIKAKNGLFDDYFIFILSQFINLGEYCGGAIPSVSKATLEEIKLIIPPTLPEQQKIADCLSSLDDLINAQDNKIKKLKEHKKGLMQGLFPSAK